MREVWEELQTGLMKWKLKFGSWWKVAFRCLSERSQPPHDELWSVIVSAACDLLSSRWPGLSQMGLSRWSPSSGGGNESGLRLLLLSVRSSTLFVSLVYLSGPPRLVDMMAATHILRWMCVCISVCLFTYIPQSLLSHWNWRIINWPLILLKPIALDSLPPPDLPLCSSQDSQTLGSQISAIIHRRLSNPIRLIKIVEVLGRVDRVTNYSRLPCAKVFRKLMWSARLLAASASFCSVSCFITIFYILYHLSWREAAEAASDLGLCTRVDWLSVWVDDAALLHSLLLKPYQREEHCVRIITLDGVGGHQLQ